MEAKTLPELMKKFGHERIDLLKMDIEGSEYEVVKSIIENKLDVRQIAMELHGRFFEDSRKKNRELLKKLKSAGYIPICNRLGIHGQDVTFIRDKG